jgi:peptidoglycan/xylan/chitin deacetylase (PgdA/CDA1 family)
MTITRRRLVRMVAVAALVLASGAAVPAPAAAAGLQAEAVTYGDRTVPAVAISFDAGSDAGYASTILDVLRSRGLHASFGITGRWAEQNPALLRRMVAEGHHLLNHTYDHQSFTGRSTGTAPLSRAQRWSELDRAEQIVHDLTGASMKPWFRPPYGDYDSSVAEDVEARGYGSVAMWTIDSLGWDGLPAAEITTRVLARVENGALLLLHVGSASEDALALPSILDGLAARGYRVGTVPEMLRWRPFDNARSFVDRQYLDLLGRPADGAGREAWRAQLLSGQRWPADVVVAMMASAEYDRVVPPVVRLYLAAFDRAPDAAGLAFWIGRVRTGASLPWVAAAFSATPEFGSVFGGVDQAGYVRLLYQHVLHRPPDAGGQQYWTAALASGRLTRSAVLLAFSDAPEMRLATWSSVTAIDVYFGLLGRQIDPGGLAYWTDHLRAGTSASAFVAYVLSSAEYAGRIG